MRYDEIRAQPVIAPFHLDRAAMRPDRLEGVFRVGIVGRGRHYDGEVIHDAVGARLAELVVSVVSLEVDVACGAGEEYDR